MRGAHIGGLGFHRSMRYAKELLLSQFKPCSGEPYAMLAMVAGARLGWSQLSRAHPGATACHGGRDPRATCGSRAPLARSTRTIASQCAHLWLQACQDTANTPA
ncbi:hypothetical protein GCM10022402_20280 [Salinactinospora qingdaonensis]|uniref:Uncharacterized protein n=1 Tax=Salinactinospora qingdaonensis TaxID=702744 RepID=A0ABP7FIQ5_9ACTN